MTDQILFDKLAYMDRLVRAGVQEDQARAHAEAMDEALREAVATKADIRDLKVDIREIKTDMSGLTSRLNVLTWVVGINVVLSLGILWLSFFCFVDYIDDNQNTNAIAFHLLHRG